MVWVISYHAECRPASKEVGPRIMKSACEHAEGREEVAGEIYMDKKAIG